MTRFAIVGCLILSTISCVNAGNLDFLTYGSDVTYPIAGTPLVDYDANFNMIVVNRTSAFWWPRSFNMSQYDVNATWPAELTRWALDVSWTIKQDCFPCGMTNRIFLPERGLWQYYVTGGQGKLYVPVDVRKSVQPVFTIELFTNINVNANSGSYYKTLFSADLSTTPLTTGTTHAPSITGYAPVGSTACRLYYQPIGPNTFTGCKLHQAIRGYNHIAAIFDQLNNNVTIVINGRYAESFTLPFVDGMPGIMLGGRAGTVASNDIFSMRMASFRIWPRALTLDELLAVNAEWFYAYNKPVVTQPWPFALFDPNPSATPVLQSISTGGDPVTLQYKHEANGSLTQTSYTYSSTSNWALAGNATYTAAAYACYHPAGPYYTMTWPFDFSQCIWPANTTMEVWTGVSPLNITSIVALSNVSLGYADQPARLQFLVRFNRQVKDGLLQPLNQPVYRGAGFSMIDLFPDSTVRGAVSLGNESFTRVSVSEPLYILAVDVLPSWPATLVSLAIPSAPVWTLRDVDGVPLFGGSWLSPNYSVVLGLTGNVTHDAADSVQLADGSVLLRFTIQFSQDVELFDATNDITLSAGSSVWNSTVSSTTISYWVQTPVRTSGADLNVTLTVSPSTLARDVVHTWNTVSQLITNRGPFSLTVQVSGTSVVQSSSSSSSTAVSSSILSSSTGETVSSSNSAVDSSSSLSTGTSSISSVEVSSSSSSVTSADESSSSVEQSSSSSFDHIISSSSSSEPSSSTAVDAPSSLSTVTSIPESSSSPASVVSSGDSSSSVAFGSSSSEFSSSSSSDHVVSSSSSSDVLSSSTTNAMSSATSSPLVSSSTSLSQSSSSSSSPSQSSSSSSLVASSAMSSSHQVTSSGSATSLPSISSATFPPRDQCAQYYTEQFLGVSIDDYVASLSPGSTRINFVMSGATVPLPRGFDVSFGTDIALNIAFMLELDEQDAGAITAFIDVADVSGCVSGPSSRRLLTVTSGDLVVSAFILANVSNAVPGLAERLHDLANDTTGNPPSSIAHSLGLALEKRVALGAFVTPTASVNITSQSTTTIEELLSSTGMAGEQVIDDESASASFEWNGGRIAGVVIGCVLGFAMIVGALMFVLSRHGKTRSDKDTEYSKTELPIYWIGV